MEKIVKSLFAMQDKRYKEFQQKLIPTVNQDRVIGVRTPTLRKYAKELSRDKECEMFLKELPHYYYEENNFHAFIVAQMKGDIEEVILRVGEFLPYVDNWATCDMFSPKIFKKNGEMVLSKVKEWLKSSHTYTVRFGIVTLMSNYLDDNYDEEIPKLVSNVKSEEYYINMAIAWFFATALAKKYDEILPYIENRKLDVWVHNKTIQKSIESLRISKERKDYLRNLKIKE